MEKYVRIFALVLALIMAATVFASCGGDSSADSAGGNDSSDAKGETQTWGNITVFVPEGFALKGGDMFDDEDPDKLTLSKDGSSFDYFLVTAGFTQDNAEMSIEGTRSANEGCEDVEIKVGDVTWKGVAYTWSSLDIVVVTAPMGEGYVLFTSSGHGKDDATFKAVLESLTVK